jgi:hypothetical protein
MAQEIWRDVITHPGLYKVSNLGRVKSLRRLISVAPSRQSPVGHSFWLSERILKSSPSKWGHHAVTLWHKFTSRQARVHRLVLEAFVGPCPLGKEGCHKNGKSSDNRLKNIYWGTPKQNNADKKRHGTHIEGEDIPWAKLTKKDVLKIRSLAGRVPQNAMAEMYGVRQPQISRIVNRKEWRHL